MGNAFLYLFNRFTGSLTKMHLSSQPTQSVQSMCVFRPGKVLLITKNTLTHRHTILLAFLTNLRLIFGCFDTIGCEEGRLACKKSQHGSLHRFFLADFGELWCRVVAGYEKKEIYPYCLLFFTVISMFHICVSGRGKGNQFSCVCLHGDRRPQERKENLEKFKVFGQSHYGYRWGTGIRGLMSGMATLPQGNQELLVVRVKVGRPPGELGVSKSMECDIFPSVL